MSNEEVTPATVASLEVRNLLSIRLAELEFNPEGRVVRVGGRNGAGKSNLLKALLWGLGGPTAIDRTDAPLRRGADKGYVQVELGGVGYRVKRSITEKGVYLTVKDADGRAIQAPQRVLDDLLGRVGIDPSAFLRLSPERQAEAVRTQCGLDLADLDAERARLYEERTATNRRLKDAEAAVRDCAGDPGGPTEEVSAQAVLDEIAEAEAHNRNQQAQRDRLGQLRIDAAAAADTVADLESRLSAARAKYDRLIAEGRELRSVVDGLEDTDTAPLRARLASLEDRNRRARENQRRRERQQEASALRTAAAGLTEGIADLDRRRTARIAAAAIPVEGLGFGADGTLTLHGHPLAQESDGIRLRTAFDLAVAARPDLRLVVLRHGADLDDDNRAAIARLAQERGCLVLMEVVGDEAGGVEILVEDGRVTQQQRKG